MMTNSEPYISSRGFTILEETGWEGTGDEGDLSDRSRVI